MFQNIWGYLILKRNMLECELLVEIERGKQQCSSKKSTLRGVLSLTVCRFCKSCLEMPQTGWITVEACLLLHFYCNLLLLNFYCSPLLNFYYNRLLLKPQHPLAHFNVLLLLLTQTQIQAALLPLFEEKRAEK